MNKIKGLVLAVMGMISTNAYAWKIDTAGCFASSEITFEDKSKGEYTISIVGDQFYVTMSSSNWDIAEFDKIPVMMVFNTGYRIAGEAFRTNSKKVLLRFPATNITVQLMIVSVSVDAMLPNGGSLVTFTLYGTEHIIPELIKCRNGDIIQESQTT